MKLTELNIVGFKSFAKKTNILFDDGMTAIVGPNGCGKSNIVDAIRWVMGEQRSSALRSEKMDNVIFNGSTSAKAVGMAEVSLKIENTQNVLPVDYTDVVVTRRLFRSGESHYLINGNQVRLKDIADLFMDTGLTGQSYSVIELPQVEKILNGQAEERRRIFEEAAGITKFKQRRKLTFRKLEATEKDLVRVEDIMSEVEKTVRSLKRQVTKAQRYQELATELKDIEVRLATHDYTHILDELEPLQTRLDLSINDREEAAAHLAQHDAEYEKLRQSLLSLERQLSESQDQYNQHSREIQKFEERILVNSERVRSLKEMQERYANERVGYVEHLTELEQALDEASYETKEARKNWETAQDEYSTLNSDYQNIRSQYDAKRSEIKTAETDILFLTEELSKKQNEGERLRATEENLSQRLQQLEHDIEQLRAQLQDITTRLQQERQKETELESEYTQVEKQHKHAAQRLEDAKQALDRLNKAELQDRNRVEVLENNAEMIRKVLENYQDYPAGVRYLATLKSDHFQAFGTVANILHVQQEHRSAISAALGESATYLVVQDENAAYSGIGLLQQDRKGVVSFLPLDAVRQRHFQHPDVDDLGIVGWANDIVRCEAHFRSVIDVLLGHYLVVQDLETANRVANQLQSHEINIVTLAGEVLGHWGIIRGGSHNKRQSDIVGRQEELTNVQQEIETLQQASERRQSQIAQKELDEQLARQETADLAAQLKELETQLSEKRLVVGRLVYEEQRLRDSIENQQHEKREIVERVGQLDQNLKSQDSSTKTLQDKRAHLNESLRTLEQELSSIESEQTQLGERVQKLQVNVAKYQSEFESAQRRSDSLKQQINETQRMIDARDAEGVRATGEIEELTQVNQEYSERIQELEAQRNQAQSKLDELKNLQYDTNVKADEQEKLIRNLRSKNQNLSESVHETKLRVSELRMRLQNLSERIKEEYDLELKRESMDEELDVQSTRERVEQIRERLKSMGPVNLLALKEYEQEKERLDFLETQRADLLKARDDLTETIDIINKTAREKFLETFEEVQKHFTSVFKTFFDGGRASLVLREGNDPLEAEIDIYAAPGGKKPSSLQLLSGGEKSLTAVSLLFAIYLVKPSPFCIFDEVDAPLDDKNVTRFAGALREFAQNTQFIVVTHNKLTMRAADQLYGVTMENEGVSQVVSVKFETAKEYAA